MSTRVDVDITDVDLALDESKARFTEQLERLRPAHEAYLRLEEIIRKYDRLASGNSARADRGSRTPEFVALVEEAGDAGITVAEATIKTGMGQSYLYRIAKEAVGEGLVLKGEDKRYRPVPTQE